MIGGETYEFGVSGKLIMNALVMYDRTTESMWSQFLSQSVSGELAGTKLETVPLTLTTWEKWKEIHPRTVALRKGSPGGDPYFGYYAGRSAGVIGEANKDSRLPTKELVLGLGFDSDPVAFPHSTLRDQQVVQLSHSDEPVLVYFDTGTETALAFSSTVEGRSLTFESVVVDEREWLRDIETGTLWVPFTGQALKGELAGTALDRLHAINVFWFAWNDFYPETDIWGFG